MEDVLINWAPVDTTQAIRMHCEKAKDFRGVEMTATANVKVLPAIRKTGGHQPAGGGDFREAT